MVVLSYTIFSCIHIFVYPMLQEDRKREDEERRRQEIEEKRKRMADISSRIGERSYSINTTINVMIVILSKSLGTTRLRQASMEAEGGQDNRLY